MPRVPLPVPGESFSSWVDAVARDSRCHPRRLLTLGWQLRMPSSRSVSGVETTLSGAELRQIHLATGVPEKALEEMRLSRFFDGPIPAFADEPAPWQAEALRAISTCFILRDHSRWCPLCIAENSGRWYLRWKLAWSYACLNHNVFLSATCPACHEPQERFGVEAADRRLFCAKTRRVMSTRGRGVRCSHPLTEVPTTPVTDPVLLDTQKWIDYGFGHGASAQPGGKSARMLFRFPLLADLVLRLRSPELFQGADPAIASAAAENIAPYSLYGLGTTAHSDSANPLLIAGAIHLGLQLVTGGDYRAKAERFAELAQRRIRDLPRSWPVDPPDVSLAQSEMMPPTLFRALVGRGLLRDGLTWYTAAH
ncbi:TniQ family protein [Streptomyces afghaniensis]|uniref:TniQ family protein n=1 Tax=Streptomyces afghaniensis TaxID=66865 RepID=UPI0037D6459B